MLGVFFCPVGTGQIQICNFLKTHRYTNVDANSETGLVTEVNRKSRLQPALYFLANHFVSESEKDFILCNFLNSYRYTSVDNERHIYYPRTEKLMAGLIHSCPKLFCPIYYLSLLHRARSAYAESFLISII